jgi:hypothetical protein
VRIRGYVLVAGGTGSRYRFYLHDGMKLKFEHLYGPDILDACVMGSESNAGVVQMSDKRNVSSTKNGDNSNV